MDELKLLRDALLLVVPVTFYAGSNGLILWRCFAGVRADDPSDGLPGWVPQILMFAAVFNILMLGALGAPGVREMIAANSGMLSVIVPLSLSPWLAYKYLRSKPDGTEVEIDRGGSP